MGPLPAPANCLSCPLRQQQAFLDKTPEQIRVINDARLGSRAYPAGATLVEQGVTDVPIMTLYSGWAFRYRSLDDGSRQILSFLLPGDLIGLQAAMMGDAEYGVECLTDVVVCLFNRARIWSLFGKLPEVSFQLTWLSSRGEMLVDDTATVSGQLSAKSRLSSFLLILIQRLAALGLVQGQSSTIPIPRQHLADALGLSLVHTVKTLRALQRDGAFKWQGHRFELLDKAVLKKLAGYERDEASKRPIL
jgi:CRP-like cAMP-binding protein